MMNVKKKFLKKPIPVIFGIKGYKLNKKEEKFFKKSNPLGFILFERNCKSLIQTKNLINNLKKITSHNKTMIMIDQEGGRVARLKKPNWNTFPCAEYFGKKAKRDLNKAKKLVFNNSTKIARDLKRIGINMNCAPVLDIKYKDTNNVIGDRSFSSDEMIVSELGKIFCSAHKKVGVIPILKHIPGHGHSDKDSHKTTPKINTDIKILNRKDFLPFKKLKNESFSMIAHIIYNKIDKQIACCSKVIINKIIKKKIGFKGLLISDDINMKALKGTVENRVKRILRAGCDIILHCNANMKEMNKIYSSIPLTKSKVLKKISKIKDLE